jgi:hypothetical protein
MKLAITLLVAIATLVACNDKKEDKEKKVIDEETTISVPTDPASDSAAIRAVIIDFYTWYTANYKKLMAFDLYSSIKKNNGAPYQLNTEEVKRYQAFIRDSIPQLGDAFARNHEDLFRKIDSAFKKDTKEDVPYYFDFDWFTNSQEEPAYLLEGLKRSQKWRINVQGDEASVEIASPVDKDYLPGSLLLYVGMKKENGQWTIARIGND